jgi:hypothetical protein
VHPVVVGDGVDLIVSLDYGATAEVHTFERRELLRWAQCVCRGLPAQQFDVADALTQVVDLSLDKGFAQVQSVV